MSNQPRDRTMSFFVAGLMLYLLVVLVLSVAVSPFFLLALMVGPPLAAAADTVLERAKPPNAIEDLRQFKKRRRQQELAAWEAEWATLMGPRPPSADLALQEDEVRLVETMAVIRKDSKEYQKLWAAVLEVRRLRELEHQGNARAEAERRLALSGGEALKCPYCGTEYSRDECDRGSLWRRELDEHFLGL